MNKINIVIIGDSNTEGYGLENEMDSYPHKLEQLFNNSDHLQI